MNTSQNKIIVDYVSSLLCPYHNLPIKYINYSTNVSIGKRLICSDCARNGMDGYFEVQTAIENINKEEMLPAKNAIQQLSKQIETFKNKIDQLINPNTYLLKNTLDKQGISKFQEEMQNYYINKMNSQNTGQIIKNGKIFIQNSIQYLEVFLNQMSSIFSHSQFKCVSFTTIYQKQYQESINVESSFEDDEFFIFNYDRIEVFTTQDSRIEIKQTISFPQIRINCITKAQLKQMFFLGRLDGIIEVYEQLTNGKYISSHQFQAHAYNLQQQQYGVSCIIINQDNQEIITGGKDNLIKQWRFFNFKWNLISTFSQNKNIINSLSYSLNCNIFGSSSQDCSFSLFKSASNHTYQHSLSVTKTRCVNTICFVNLTNFFISLNQENIIYLYQITNPLEQQYKIQPLSTIDLNEINTDLAIIIQPRYYQQLNTLIFQHNKKTFILNSKDQNKFEIIPIKNQQCLEGNMFRLFQFGQLSIQIYQRSNYCYLEIAKML